MDKLQWFKFTPSDWMMGKIQRCPEVTQARFLRLCCLYWNKQCEISIDDAIIEIEIEHFNILKAKKIISVTDTHFNISFLDEQFLDINENSKSKSNNGIIGNLKRWHPEIYSKFEYKEISLSEAVKQSQSIATRSLPDRRTIAEQSQSIAEKKRKEKINNNNNHEFFKSQCLSQDLWKNETAKMLKLNTEHFNPALTEFNSHLISTDEKHNNLKNYKYHFISWSRKQIKN